MTGKSLPVALFLAVAFVTYDEVAHQGHVPPYPQRFVFVGIVYGLLGVLDVVAPPVAAVLAWGFVLAFAYKAVGASDASTGVTDAATSPAVTSPAAAVVAI